MSDAPKINYDLLAPSEVAAERDRAQMGQRIRDLRTALLKISAIIETQTEPDVDLIHDVVRAALLVAPEQSK